MKFTLTPESARRDVLNNRHGALPDERDGRRVGADTLARDANARRERRWTSRAAHSSGLLHSRQPSYEVPMRRVGRSGSRLFSLYFLRRLPPRRSLQRRRIELES